MTIQRMLELLEIEHECMLRGAHDDCGRNCADCELVQDDYELHEMYTDVIALLKEQEAVEPTFRQDEDGVFAWACGSCGAYMYHIYDGIDKAKEYAKYCRQCGRKVKWNDNTDS